MLEACIASSSSINMDASLKTPIPEDAKLQKKIQKQKNKKKISFGTTKLYIVYKGLVSTLKGPCLTNLFIQEHLLTWSYR